MEDYFTNVYEKKVWGDNKMMNIVVVVVVEVL